MLLCYSFQANEIHLALLTNIEKERRKSQCNLVTLPEHPGASTSDDVGRDLVGSSFTLKTIQEEWKKHARGLISLQHMTVITKRKARV